MAQYDIANGKGEIVLDNATEEQVREFTAGLNNYESWKKNCANFTILEVIGLLNMNGYTATAVAE